MAGALYLYEEKPGTGWSAVADQRFVATVPESNGYFGGASAVVGDTLLIGAPYNEVTGAVYAYQHDGSQWVYDSTILPDDTAVGFGVAISADEDTAMIGATGITGADTGEGSVYMFTSN